MPFRTNILSNMSSRFLAHALWIPIFLAASMAPVLIESAAAATCTFTSTEVTNDFNRDDNWDCGHAPTADDDVVIPLGEEAILTAPATFGALTVAGTLNGDAFNLNATSTVVVESTGVVTSTTGDIYFGVNGGFTPETTSVSSSGAIGSSYGAITFTSPLENNGTIQGGTVAYFPAFTGTVSFFNLVENNGTISGTASYIMLYSTLTNNGTYDNQRASSLFYGAFNNQAAGTLKGGSGTLLIAAGITNSGLIAPETGYIAYNVNDSVPTDVLPIVYNHLNITGYVTGTAFLAASTTVMGNLVIYSPARLNTQGFDLTVLGSVSAVSGVSLHFGTGAVDIGGAAYINGEMSATSARIMFRQSVTVDSEGSLSLGAASVTSTNFITNQGTINGETSTIAFTDLGGLGNAAGGVFHPGTSTIRYYTTGGAAVEAGSYYNLELLSSPGTFSFGTDTSIGGNLVLGADALLSVATEGVLIGGTTTVDGTLDVAAGHVTSTGDFTVNASGAFLSSGGGDATLALGGNYSVAGASDLGLFHVTIIGSGNQYLDGFIASRLTLDQTGGYSAVLVASSTVLGSLIGAGEGSLNVDEQDLTVLGDVNIGSLSVVTSTSGTILFQGSVTSSGAMGTVTGDILFSDTLDNSGVIHVASGNVTSTAAFTNSGTVYGGSGRLVFAPAGSSCGAFTNSGDFIPGASTVYLFDQPGGCSLRPSFSQYYNLVLEEGDIQSAASTTVGGTMTIRAAATYNGQESDEDGLNVAGALSNAGTLTVTGPVSVGTLFTNSGTVTVASNAVLHLHGATAGAGSFTSASNAAVKYSSSGAVDIIPTVYGALQFLGAGVYSLTASTTAVATTTIASGATLSLVTFDYTGAGDIVNAGLVSVGTGRFVHPVDYVRVTDATGSSVSSLSDGGSLYVTVYDPNRNLDGSSVETFSVSFAVDSAGGSDTETILLTETSASSGVFRNATAVGVRQSAVSPGNSSVDITGSGVGTASYTDEGDSESADVTLVYVAPPSSAGSSSGGGGLSAGSSSGGVLQTFFDPPSVTSVPVSSAPVAFAPTPSPSGADQAAAPVPTASTVPGFIETGSTPASRALGRGERQAILRDAQETMGRPESRIPASDLERMANGQIPLTRNLSYERSMAPRALATFRTIFGHAPNFQDERENLAWNTLMYRIRFPRDLTLERQGIAEFRRAFGRDPQTPFQWAAVRVMGYVDR